MNELCRTEIVGATDLVIPVQRATVTEITEAPVTCSREASTARIATPRFPRWLFRAGITPVSPNGGF